MSERCVHVYTVRSFSTRAVETQTQRRGCHTVRLPLSMQYTYDKVHSANKDITRVSELCPHRQPTCFVNCFVLHLLPTSHSSQAPCLGVAYLLNTFV